ncbi:MULTISPECIES: hypothetical protein [Chryseobacterium]|jgi:hypothetical protein|uniref:hypothetical protein n=1 Tax=Chryseobacterium TaxID=59732 RepID=UPI000D36FF2D|nr:MULTISPECIES: hypothetical protein [Chryseobacterium]MCQ4141781.1 hypothetical protein [Chryseobacterium sp. EO14]PTT74486.1 hypothetical protein DBR25_10645 [Chryseobacterium sp. HMWF001]PVV58621.1 hypothetical protein DD829_06770 [Chryseobacterium sp. HMWF035]WBV51003.1 hypothetical protein PFY09_11725 [Chryseobacterium gambrini]
MKTKIILLFFGLLSFLPNAQIGISKDTSFQPDSRAMLHIKQDNFAARIPRSNTALSLPVSETATTGTGTQGSIIFNRETGSIVQNDGTTWKISDPIVSTMKSNKMARFIRSGVVTSSCGTCGLACALTVRTCSTENILFTNSSPVFNDISSSVALASTNSNVININEKGLYKISFKSGAIDISTPLCAGVVINLQSRVNLELSSSTDATWRPINNNSSSSTSGALSVTTLAPGAIDVGQALSFTYVGVFNAGDKLRLTMNGTQNIGTGVCTGVLGGNNMFFSMDKTGNSVSEIIIEKINM